MRVCVCAFVLGMRHHRHDIEVVGVLSAVEFSLVAPVQVVTRIDRLRIGKVCFGVRSTTYLSSLTDDAVVQRQQRRPRTRSPLMPCSLSSGFGRIRVRVTCYPSILLIRVLRTRSFLRGT